MPEVFFWQPQRQDISQTHRMRNVTSGGKIPWNGRNLWGMTQAFGPAKPVEDKQMRIYWFGFYYNFTGYLNAGLEAPVIFTTGDAAERLYVGADRPFNNFSFNVVSNQLSAGLAAWSYWNGTEAELTITQNDFSDLLAVENGTNTVAFNAPIDWKKNVISGSELYWVWATYTGRMGGAGGTGINANAFSVTNDGIMQISTYLKRQKRITHRYLFDLTSSDKSATKFVDDLKDFYVSRKGQYESFYLPSWREESQLSNDVTAGSNVITVDKPEIFSTNIAEHGNRVFLLDSSWLNYDVKSISSISGNNLTLDANLDNTYTSGTPVHHCYEVLFSNPTFREDYLLGNVYVAEVNFLEVI